MFQLDWDATWLDTWSNIFLSVSVGMVLEEIHIKLVAYMKQIALQNVGGPHLIIGRPEKNRRLTLPPGTKNYWQSSNWGSGSSGFQSSF